MATVQITIDDTLIPRVKAAMRATYTGPTYDPLTDVQCFRLVTAQMWREVLRQYETGDAAVAALNTKAVNDATAGIL